MAASSCLTNVSGSLPTRTTALFLHVTISFISSFPVFYFSCCNSSGLKWRCRLPLPPPDHHLTEPAQKVAVVWVEIHIQETCLLSSGACCCHGTESLGYRASQDSLRARSPLIPAHKITVMDDDTGRATNSSRGHTKLSRRSRAYHSGSVVISLRRMTDSNYLI